MGYCRMRNSFKFATGSWVRKNDSPQNLPVQAAAIGQDLHTKNINQLRQGRTAGVDNFPGQVVRTHQNSAALRKTVGNKTFPGSNSPGHTENHDMASPKITR